MEKLLLSITDFCDATSLGPTMVKTLIRQGRIPSVKIGDRRLIPAQAARDYVSRLLAEAGEAA
jgi:excisionase family DNA binding protein